MTVSETKCAFSCIDVQPLIISCFTYFFTNQMFTELEGQVVLETLEQHCLL
jgi:hypothetical protein